MHRFKWCLATLVLGGLVGAPISGQEQKEPKYKGKPIGHWIKLLSSEKEEDRHVAFEAVVSFGPEAKPAVPVLIEMLADKYRGDRDFAAWLLGRIGPPAKDAVPALITLLKDDSTEVQETAVNALGAIGPEARTALPALLQLLKDEQAWYKARQAAARMAAEISPEAPEVLTGLTAALRAENSLVRKAAVDALGQLGPKAKDAVPDLRRAYRYRHLQSHVIYALGRIGPAAITTLIELFEVEEADKQKSQVAYALAGNAEQAKAAVPLLLKALKGEDMELRLEAARALWRIEKHSNAVPTLVEIMEETDSGNRAVHGWGSYRYRAVVLLEEIGPDAKSALPALRRALKDKDESVQYAAARAIEKIDAKLKEENPPKEGAMSHENARV